MDTHDHKPETNASGFIAPTSNAVEPEFELSTVPGHENAAPIPEEAAIADSAPIDPKPKKSRTPFQESLRRFRRDKRAMISLIVILCIVVIAILGPFIYHHIGGLYKQQLGTHIIGPDVYHTYDHQELDRAHEMPSPQYWLGTDGIGRDILARLMQGMLISIVLAVVVEIVDISLGITVGVLAGYYGGWIDQFLARLADLLFAFPGLLFIILVAGILGGWADDTLGAVPVIGAGGNARLLLISIVLAFTSWPLMARYVRGQTLQIKEQQYIEAARTSGTNDLTILTRHIVPNLFSIVMVASTLNIAGTIIGEAGISYLGLGVRPPGASIGLMISDASQSLSAYPWELLVPSLTLVIIVLSFSFIGDGLRDAFDPHSKD
ncbi:glutathione transport system permease protein GsiD [Dictyobacter vulcani]|uniref:Glutathione transport system permease protein GsiD n=1 Tax=Dictyobacter vulcani TaxID=2607529 RepID=A0A5J4KSI8_9CHLR|nr:ABC transporter permease [Dictyobacter vulcani]GER89410.1 glutathione transport system permease protein GsiD [Dictyobacter vulcani]